MSDTIYASYPVFAASPELRAELFEDDALGSAAERDRDRLQGLGGRGRRARLVLRPSGSEPDADLICGSRPRPRGPPAVPRRVPPDARRRPARSRRQPPGPREARRVHARPSAGVRPRRAAAHLPLRLPVRPLARVVPPAAARAGGLLAEHGTLGREFPQVLANTTSAFGLGDWEWILAFETDELDALVDCIRLRDSKTRLYTKVETPFFTGIRKPIADCLDDSAEPARWVD